MLGVALTIQRSTRDQKGPMSFKSALRRAKRIKHSEVLMCIDQFFRSSHVFSWQKCYDAFYEKTSIMSVNGVKKKMFKNC